MIGISKCQTKWFLIYYWASHLNKFSICVNKLLFTFELLNVVYFIIKFQKLIVECILIKQFYIQTEPEHTHTPKKKKEKMFVEPLLFVVWYSVAFEWRYNALQSCKKSDLIRIKWATINFNSWLPAQRTGSRYRQNEKYTHFKQTTRHKMYPEIPWNWKKKIIFAKKLF